MDYLDSVPVCTGYRYKGSPIDSMPALAEEYERVVPVYQERPGWNRPTAGATEFASLPQAARDYIAFLEDSLEIEIGGVSTGPKRDETIIRNGSVLEGLVSSAVSAKR